MSRISHHFLAVLAMCIMGVSTANLSAAAFSDENWSSMGDIINQGPQTGGVWAMATDGSGNLTVGGAFTIAGGVFATNIAKWSGSSWSALGSGTSGGNNYMFALAVSGSDLYAGGHFTMAGGMSATNIAKWNGSSWSALGSGMNADVFALAASSSDLYAAGDFGTAGGIAASGIAKWNGSSWSALGSGMNARVQALAISGNDLYAGGDFTMAGGKVSAGVARARIGSIVQSVALANSTPTIQFSGVTGYHYDVQRTTSLALPTIWTTITPSPLSPAPDGSFTFTDTNAPPSPAFYRARELP